MGPKFSFCRKKPAFCLNFTSFSKPGTASAFQVVKVTVMKTTLLLKEIYFEAFRNLGNYLVKNSLKVFSWFCFALFFIALYALVYRMATGFVFD
jgi:hypothetical protein